MGEILSDSGKLAIHVVWRDIGMEPIGAQSTRICSEGRGELEALSDCGIRIWKTWIP